MEPVSVVASVWTLVTAVKEINQFARQLYHVRDADTEVSLAKRMLILVQAEGRELRELRCSFHDARSVFQAKHLSDALDTAQHVFNDIETSFPPLDDDVKSFRKRLRWTFKDKDKVEVLLRRLSATENTLSTILQLDQIRIGQMMWTALSQQAKTLARIEAQQALIWEQQQQQQNYHPRHSTVKNELSRPPQHSVVLWSRAPPSLGSGTNKSTAQLLLVKSSRNSSSTYTLMIQICLCGINKVVTASFKFYWPEMSFSKQFNARNIVPRDSNIAKAVRTGNVELVRYLFSTRQAFPKDVVSSSGTLTTLLEEAVAAEQTNVVQLLLDNGADPGAVASADQIFPIHTAFTHNRSDLVRQLLLAGADIEDVTSRGMTVVGYLALFFDDSASLGLLNICTSQGFNGVDIRDADGRTALHIAAERGDVPFIKELLRMGASVDARDNYGMTPIWHTLHSDNIEAFEELTRVGCPNGDKLLNDRGWTLFHYASFHSAEQIMTSLLRAGADPHCLIVPNPNIKDDTNMPYGPLSARDIAFGCGQDHYHSYITALQKSGYSALVDQLDDVFWDAEEIYIPGVASGLIRDTRLDIPDNLRTLLRNPLQDVRKFEAAVRVGSDMPLYYGWDLYHVAVHYGSESCLRFMLTFWSHKLCPSRTSWITRMKISLKDLAVQRGPETYAMYMRVVGGLDCDECAALALEWAEKQGGPVPSKS